MIYKLGQRFYDDKNDVYILIIGYCDNMNYKCVIFSDTNKNQLSYVNVTQEYLDSEYLYLMKEGETVYVTKSRINHNKTLDNIDFSSIGVPLWTKSLAVNSTGDLIAFNVLKDNLYQDDIGFWYSKIVCDYAIIDNGYYYNENSINKIDTPEFNKRSKNTTYQNLEYLELTKKMILDDSEYSFSKDIQYYILDDYYFITIYYYKDNTYSLVINENLSSSKGIKFNKEQRDDIINLLKKY